jgi:hypothetical protein
MVSMMRFWRRHRERKQWKRRLLLFAMGAGLCLIILLTTLYEKFAQGGWITVTITAIVIGVCFLIRRHYRGVAEQLERLYEELGDVAGGSGLFQNTSADKLLPPRVPASPLPRVPLAGILVGSYNGVGIHTVLNIFRTFPGHFKGIVFLSVGVVDSGQFKGEHALDELRARTEEMLSQYVALADSLGVPATSRLAIGTEAVAEAEQLCLATAKEFPRIVFFAGKMIFQRERWYHRLLHNETALAVEKRLRWAGITMMTLPIRVREPAYGVRS